MADQISGYVNRVVFHRDDFYILAVAVQDSNIAGVKRIETVRGNLFGLLQIKSGVPIQLEGTWQEDPKHGHQLVVRTWQPWARSSEDVSLFLHTCIDGFADVALADLVADAYGIRAFAQLSTQPVVVQELFRSHDIHEDDAEDALRGWQQTLASRDLSELLREGGLGAFDVQAAIFRFGSEAPTILRENPYRLMEIPTLSFPKVDRLARVMGVGADDLRRVEGAILWGLHSSAQSGHTYLGRNEILPTVEDLITAHHLVALTRGEAKPVFLEALRNLIARKALIHDPKAGLYAPSLYHYERKSAEILANLLVPSKLDVDLQPFFAEYERATKITLSDAQRQAVQCLTENRVLVLTGLPGTGKTTAIRVLVRAFEAAKVDFALMAPTGIASKRLSTVTGHVATTIHRGLKFNGMTWGNHEHNRLLYDAVILDEVSMVDQELIYRLLVALRPDVRLVLVGDDAQLPSVGPGNVLRELADCACVPNVRLTQIFRQSEKGEIVINAHRINRGEMIQTESQKSDTEFKFVRMSDEAEIARLVVEMASKLKAKDANFQVMTAKYEGVVGVNSLNEKLRDRLNPKGPQEWKRGDQHFRLGDRLMVVQNDYRRGVYNGDVGKLVFIDRNQLVVRIHDGGDGADVEVEFDDAAAEGKLRLAYAVTVHKSQGQEFDTVILPIVSGQGRMLQRNLLYTAVTRARKRVWLIGEEVAIQKALANNQVLHRNTAFSQAILDAVQAMPASGVLEADESGRSHDKDDSRPEGGSGPSAGRTNAQAEGDAEGA